MALDPNGLPYCISCNPAPGASTYDRIRFEGYIFRNGHLVCALCSRAIPDQERDLKMLITRIPVKLEEDGDAQQTQPGS